MPKTNSQNAEKDPNKPEELPMDKLKKRDAPPDGDAYVDIGFNVLEETETFKTGW